MLRLDLDVLRCPRCSSGMDCDVLAGDGVVREGILLCRSCGLRCPVVSGIPVLWDDLGSYLSSRHSVGLQMMRLAGSPSLRDIIAESMPPDATHDERGSVERRWAAIYSSGFRSQMYGRVSSTMARLSPRTMLEHGCSVGTLSGMMASRGCKVTGLDRSFPALLAARRRDERGLYAVADSAREPPVVGLFNVVVALNMLELVEPRALLESMASRVDAGCLVVADPYDYSRGDCTVDEPLDCVGLRRFLREMGFDLVMGTDEPSFIPWNIRISPRTTVRYLVDLVVAKKV